MNNFPLPGFLLDDDINQKLRDHHLEFIGDENVAERSESTVNPTPPASTEKKKKPLSSREELELLMAEDDL